MPHCIQTSYVIYHYVPGPLIILHSVWQT